MSVVTPKDIDNEISKLNTVLKKMKKSSGKVEDKITLLQIDNFLLPAIFLLEPVSKDTLINIVSVAIDDEKNAFQYATIAITILTNKRHIELTPDGDYKLTKWGEDEFYSFKHNRKRVKKYLKTFEIDSLRLEILNLKNRKKKMKV